MNKYSYLFTIGVLTAVIVAAACAPMPPEERVYFSSDYWQRSDVTSSLYLRGTEAQQRLNQDIVRCVNDIRGLEAVAGLRESIPADNKGGAPPDPVSAKGRLAQWDSPERRGSLYHEHLDYHDLETCMQSAGWERVESAPHKVVRNARDVYIETVTGEKPE